MSSRLRILLSLLSMVLCGTCSRLRAQDTLVAALPVGQSRQIVTLSRPLSERTCKVESMDPTSVTCASRLHRARIIPLADIGEVIRPCCGSNATFFRALLDVGWIPAGLLIGGIFVASAPVSVTLYALASGTGYLVYLVAGMASDCPSAVLYLRPGFHSPNPRIS